MVVNLHHQSNHWPHRGVKMEKMTSFAVEMEAQDTLMSWDIKSGYRHLRLHPYMRDFFLFRYDGRYYRFTALPFGWGPSALYFTNLMRPVAQYIRNKWCWRVLPYLDDFLLAPALPGRAFTPADCAIARKRLTRLMCRVGLLGTRRRCAGMACSAWTTLASISTRSPCVCSCLTRR